MLLLHMAGETPSICRLRTRKSSGVWPAIPANAVGMSNLPGLRLSEGVRPTTGEAVPAGSAPDGLFGYLFP